MIQRTLLRQSRALRTSIIPSPRPSSIIPSIRPVPSSVFASSRQLSSSRWYSSEQKNATESTEQAEGDKKGEEQKESENPLAAELEKKNKEIIDLKDKYLRSVAEFRNLQERTAREVKAAKDFAIQKFAKDLVDTVDNLDRALATVPEEKISSVELKENEHVKDLVNLYEGLKMTETIFMSTLKKHGLERFDPSVGEQKFNPNEHEATFMTAMPDKEDGTCFHTQQKGFKLNGRILRAAKVGVVKNS